MKTIKLFFLIAMVPAIMCLTTSCDTKNSNQELTKSSLNKIQSKLYFEQNMGQLNHTVQYLMKGKNHNVFLTDNDLVMTINEFRKPLKKNANYQLGQNYVKTTATKSWFKMKFPGSNPDSYIEGYDELSSRSNYLKGNDAEKWVTNVPHFGKVAYRDLYQGIDLIYYGNDNYLEYDFVVEPNVDPGLITMDFEGVDDLSVNKEGDLVLKIGDNTIRHKKPLAYQQIDGVKQEVESEYVLDNEDNVSFYLDDYNPEHELIIDPIITYSTFIGTSGNDQGHDIVTDKDGNMYIIGMTNSQDFPVTPGSYDQFLGSSGDQINPFDLHDNPNALDFTYNAGDYSVSATNDVIDPTFGPEVTFTADPNITPYPYDDDYAVVNLPFQFPFQDQTYNTIYVNSDGNITLGSGVAFSYRKREDMIFGPPRIALFYHDLAPVVFGFGTVHADVRADRVVVTWSDVPAFSGDYSSLSDPNTFQAILHSNGDIQIIYDDIDEGYGAVVGLSEGNNPDDIIEVDLSESTGSETSGTIFEVFILGDEYDQDALIMKFNKDGELVWSTYLGGSFIEYGQGISLDKNGDVYAYIGSLSADMPLIGGLARPYSGGYLQFDTYVAKLDNNGSYLKYASYIGGSSLDIVSNIVVDDKSNAYLAGITLSTDLLDGESPSFTGAFASQGGIQPFVVKLNSSGSLTSFTYFPASTMFRFGYQTKGVELDHSGNVILTGTDNSGNVPTSPASYQPNLNGEYDVFVARLNKNLTNLMTATYLGGSGSETDSEFTIDKKGNIYISAMTSSSDFPVTKKAFDKSHNGGYDGYISKLSSSLDKLEYSTLFGGVNEDQPRAIVVHNSGEVFVAGITHSSDFPLTDDTFDNTVVAGEAFLMRVNKKGSKLKFSTLFGGDGEDLPLGIDLFRGDNDKDDSDEALQINLTGLTKSLDFPTTPNAFDDTHGNIDGWNDAILMSFLFNDEDDNDSREIIYAVNSPQDAGKSTQSTFSKQYAQLTAKSYLTVLNERNLNLKKSFYSNIDLQELKNDYARRQSAINQSGLSLLQQNYPNPFSTETQIEFQLEESSHVVLRIFGLDGQEILRLADHDFNAGIHILKWDGTDKSAMQVPSGLYIIHLQAGTHSETKKISLLR